MKKIFFLFAIVAIAAVAAFNIHMNFKQENKLTALNLANIEALAGSEGWIDDLFRCQGKSRTLALDIKEVYCPITKLYKHATLYASSETYCDVGLFGGSCEVYAGVLSVTWDNCGNETYRYDSRAYKTCS